jgi:uncharacterized protein (TIGR00369 family)
VTERSLRVEWQDPLPGARAARELSGIDYLRAIVAGRFPPPPMAMLLGFGLESVDEGRAAFFVDPAEHHYNPIGMVHGGLLATLLDSAMGCAVHSKLPAGLGYTTTDLHVHYTRAVGTDTGRLRAEAEIVHFGSRMATASGRVTDASGRLYAHATATCFILRPEGR